MAGRVEIDVRRGDDANVDGAGRVRADPAHLALLQHAQELRLERQRHVADLVEEDRAVVRCLEEARARADGARERALLVTEQLRLEQALRERRAVDRHERLAAPVRGAVQRVRDALLADAAHAVCTYSSTTGEVKVYLNNVAEVTSTLTASDIIYANDEFTIGHIPTGAGANGFIGHIDQVLYYNRAITANEVCEIYTGATCSVPNAPTNLNATLNGSNQVDLTWTDNSSDETVFNVQRSDDGGLNYSSVATPTANSTAFQDITVNPSTTYYYRVFATNNYGNSGISNVVSVSTNAVGMDETSEEQISVAPNPSTGIFAIQAPGHWQQAQLTITGINGITVYESLVNNFTAPKLEKGVYLLILNNPGKKVVKRIVIQ